MANRRDVVYAKMKLSYRDQSNQVRSMLKTRQNNDVTDHIGLIYAKI